MNFLSFLPSPCFIISFPLQMMKGGSQDDRPRPLVIIPSAAYGGAIISFILCPSELVKVWLWWNSCRTVFHVLRFMTQSFSSVGCKSKALTLCFLSRLNTEAPSIVLLEPWNLMGWEYPWLSSCWIYCMLLSWWDTFQVTGIFRGGTATFLREFFGNAVFFTTYEHVRYYMHSSIKAQSNWLDVGIGIVSGGLGGVAVSDSTICIF